MAAWAARPDRGIDPAGELGAPANRMPLARSARGTRARRGGTGPSRTPPAGCPAPIRAVGKTRQKFRIESEWCCQTGLNCRPLHYQWSALPLSYGSMPGSGESAQKGPYRRAVLATTTPQAQARGRVRRVQEGSKNQAVAPASWFNRRKSGRIRVPVSVTLRRQPPQRAKHDLEFDHFAGFIEFDAIDTPQLASCRVWRKIPAWRHETVPAVQGPLRQCTWFGHWCILRVLLCARAGLRCRTIKQSATGNRG